MNTHTLFLQSNKDQDQPVRARTSSLQELIGQQLAAVEQVLAVSSELAHRLDAEGHDALGLAQLNGAAKALRLARSPTQDSMIGVIEGEPQSTYRSDHDRSPLLGDNSVVIGKDLSYEQKGSFLGDETVMQAAQSVTLEKAHMTPSTGLFADSNDIKRQVRKALESGHTEDEDLYSDTGWAQVVARNDTFKAFTFVVLAVSSLWVAFDTDFNKPDASPGMRTMFAVMDNLFCVFFSFEITIRFLAFKNKCDALHLLSFNFDLMLVVTMVIDLWLMAAIQILVPKTEHHASDHLAAIRILRLSRLFRLARVGRLVRAMPDLAVLVRGMFSALRAVGSICLLLVAITYIFAVGFTEVLSGATGIEHCFETVPKGMYCLLMKGVFNGQSDLIGSLLDMSWLYFLFIIVYFTLACLTVMKMLIGVICNVITTVAKAEKEARVIVAAKHDIREVMRQIHYSKDTVTRADMLTLIQNPDLLSILHGMGVDVVAWIDMSDFFFAKCDELPFDEFVNDLMMFQKSNVCTVKDAVDIRLYLSRELKKMESRLRCSIKE